MARNILSAGIASLVIDVRRIRLRCARFRSGIVWDDFMRTRCERQTQAQRQEQVSALCSLDIKGYFVG